jgi:hypothetical protein
VEFAKQSSAFRKQIDQMAKRENGKKNGEEE